MLTTQWRSRWPTREKRERKRVYQNRCYYRKGSRALPGDRLSASPRVCEDRLKFEKQAPPFMVIPLTSTSPPLHACSRRFDGVHAKVAERCCGTNAVISGVSPTYTPRAQRPLRSIFVCRPQRRAGPAANWLVCASSLARANTHHLCRPPPSSRAVAVCTS
jgi:hypothetical protein